MISDYESSRGRYGRIVFPVRKFRYIANRMFPLHFGAAGLRNESTRQIEGSFHLVQPRSTPEGAPVIRNNDGPILWADAQHVWGKVAYTIKDTVNGEIISTTSALMKLISLEILGSTISDLKLRYFREGWSDLLWRYVRENPHWFLNPPPVKDFIFMDVLSHRSVSTRRGYERALETKRRMGKLIPSIMGR